MSEHSTGELITDQEIKRGQTLQDLTFSEPAAFAEAQLEYRFISSVNPVQVLQPAGPGAAESISTFDGTLAFVLNYDNLEVINVADLQAPTVTVSLAVSEQANAVFVGTQTGLLKVSLMQS